MIEWINEIFGVKNEVSVPTLISLIVFIIGGLINYFFIKLKEYNLRRISRETFIHLLEQTVKDLQIKEKNMAEFYPQIATSRVENWKFSHHGISYLETILDFDFIQTYYSFRRKFFFSCNKKVKIKAFHRIWSKLKRLSFFEEKIQENVKGLSNSFSKHQETYNLHIEKYREHKEKQGHEINQGEIDISEKDVAEFLKEEDNIWILWSNLGEKRFNLFYSYNELVKPLLLIHRKYSDSKITLESAQLLVLCELEYHNLEISLKSYHWVFKDYYLGFRRDAKLLKEYIKRI